MAAIATHNAQVQPGHMPHHSSLRMHHCLPAPRPPPLRLAAPTWHKLHDKVHALLVLEAGVHAHQQRVVQGAQDVALAAQVRDLEDRGECGGREGGSVRRGSASGKGY